MNKKVKSLLVAGLLVVGMSGNVFGLEKTEYKGNDGKEQCEHSVANKIDSPTAGEHIIAGVVKVTISEDLKYAKVEPLKNEAGVTLAKINAVHMKGGPNYNCYVLGEDEGWVANLSCPLNGGKNIPEISHISVDFDVIEFDDENKNGIPDHKEVPEDPEVPENPISGPVDPQTGDVGMMGVAVVAVASAAGLYLLKNKDDEE